MEMGEAGGVEGVEGIGDGDGVSVGTGFGEGAITTGCAPAGAAGVVEAPLHGMLIFCPGKILFRSTS